MSVTDEKDTRMMWTASNGDSQEKPRALKFDSKKSPVH